MRHQVTIKDIAKQLGVSVATVSRALRDLPDIHPDTKKLVLDLAQELDYQPNEFMDDQKQLIVCSTHGAIYHPVSGECISGPCRGEILEKLNVTESNDVLWVEIY